MKNKLRYLLYIFPVLYLVLGFYFRQIFGDLSLRSTDPEYIDFLSGMCVSTGKFAQTNIDHPGSPLQLILGLVFRIIYLFRSGQYPFFEDAMIHSDLYLAVGNLLITAILSVSIYLAGSSIFKITKNWIYAIIIQASPFLINIWYEIYGRIYPELLLLIPVLIFQVQIVRILFNGNKNQLNEVLIFSFATAFGMAEKMTFLPFVLIPLVLIRPIKRKIQFVLFSSFFFLILALPVTLQLERFWNWMKGMFLHSGMYESGDKNIIDIQSFLTNLTNLLQSEKYFFILLLALVISTVVIFFFKPRRTDTKKELALITGSLLMTFLVAVFIVAKQYATRYFIPVLLFNPFLFILITENIKQISTKKYLANSIYLVILLLMLHNFKNHIPYIRITSEGIEKQMEARTASRDFINTLEKDSYKIIVSQDYGCPYHEYAIMYSFCVAGKEWPGYREKLDKIYPNTYQYFTWDNTIKFWGKEFNPDEIIASDKPVFLYLEKNTEELYQKTIEKLFENKNGFSVDKKLLFENPVNGEGILQLFFSQQMENQELLETAPKGT